MIEKKRGAFSLLLSLSLLLAGLALAGCSSNGTDRQVLNGLDQKHGEQVLNLALNDTIPTLDSSKAGDSISLTVLGQIGEGLTRLDRNGRAIPAAAKDWSVSMDGLTYVFHLRDDARWSDGSPVTASDFEYAWKRTLDPKTEAPSSFMVSWLDGGSAYNLGRGSADQVGVKAKDDKTLEVTLQTPMPFFAEQIAFPAFFPQKQAFVEKQGSAYGTSPQTLLSNGPFQLTLWQPEQTAILEKNGQYWDRDDVQLVRVEYQVVKGAEARANLYDAGLLDHIAVQSDQAPPFRGQPDYETHPALAAGYLEYNLDGAKALQNNTIRKALTYALDGDQYGEIVYQNGTVGATGMVPFGTSNGQGGDFRADNGDLINRKQNMPRAKAMLVQGLKELGLSSLPELHLLTDDSVNGRKTATFISEQWRQKLGISVVVDLVPFKTRFKLAAAHQFDILLSVWIADYNDPMTFLDLWLTKGPFNDVSYSNPAYDILLAKAARATDSAKRTQDLMQAEKILMDDMPVGPLFFGASASVTKPYVKGWQSNLLGPEYDLKGVSIDGN